MRGCSVSATNVAQFNKKVGGGGVTSCDTGIKEALLLYYCHGYIVEPELFEEKF